MNPKQKQIGRGGGWVAGQIALMATCAVLGLLGSDQPSPGWIDLVSLLLVLLGAVFGLAGVQVLGRNRTIYPEPRLNSRLVQHGIYRWIRHPLYTSVMLLAVAWGCWCRSLPALIGAAALILFLFLKSRNEEARLLRLFPEYAAYRTNTRRFIPWII